MDPGIIYVTAYIPYVEEVTIPDPIYADEDFTLTMHLTSALQPDLLRANMHGRLWEGPGINPAIPDLLLFPMWMKGIDDINYTHGNLGPPVQSTDYEYQDSCTLPEGHWTIGVQSARTQQLGGSCLKDYPLDYLIEIGGSSIVSPETTKDDVVYRLFPVTVVKRPGS